MTILGLILARTEVWNAGSDSIVASPRCSESVNLSPLLSQRVLYRYEDTDQLGTIVEFV